MGLGQYLKETRSELRHVAWPTRTQTIVFAALVIAISIGIAAYLGLLDFLFSKGVAAILNTAPSAQTSPIQIQQTATGTMPVFSATSTQ